MKKLFSFSFALILMLIGWSAPCFALEPVGVDVWVSIKNGGTAIITPKENSPAPEQSRLVLKSGSPGAFHFQLSTPGVFSYSVAVEPDDRDLIFDKTVYDVEIYALLEEDELHATVVAYDRKSGMKVDSVQKAMTFKNEEASAPDPPPHKGGRSSSHQPKTGDDSRLTHYLLLAIFSAAGLFAVSVTYYISVTLGAKRNR